MRVILSIVWLTVTVHGCHRPQELDQGSRPHATALNAPSAAAPSTRVEPPSRVDLLRRSDVQVSVSSYNDARGQGQFLIDSQLDTVWRPNRTDPLPWVQVELSPGSTADSLTLSVGRRGGSTPAHSASWGHVVVEQDGQLLTDCPLQNDTETLCKFGETHPGATLRLKAILAPNSRSNFPGFAELSIHGKVPRAQLLADGFPEVYVASSRVPFGNGGVLVKPLWQGAPYKNMEAFCAAYRKLYDQLPVDGTPPFETKSPRQCRVIEELTPDGTVPEHAPRIRVVVLTLAPPNERGLYDAAKFLLFDGPEGIYPGNLLIDSDLASADDRAGVRYLVRIEKAEWQNEQFVLRLLRHTAVSGAYASDGVYAVGLSSINCSAKGRPTCRRSLVAWGDTNPEANPQGFRGPDSREIPVRPKTWQWQRQVMLLPSGSVRFGACHDDTERTVPCYADKEGFLP